MNDWLRRHRKARKKTLSLLFGATTAAVGTVSAPGYAQSSYYYAGRAASGAQIAVDLASIRSNDGTNARFDYWLGDELMVSEAHCNDSGDNSRDSWTTLNDGVVHYAQSQATQNMVRIVCSYFVPVGSTVEVAAGFTLPESVLPMPASMDPEKPVVEISTISSTEPVAVAAAGVTTALVYDPVSNVRATPNGTILCSIDTRAYINIYGSLGDWYDTDACGSRGVIHFSQIQF